MKRKLLTQIRHEWRGNIWMLLEFTLMAVVFWFSASYLFAIADQYHPSKNFDFNDVYVGYFRTISPISPKYTEYSTTDDKTDEVIRRYNSDKDALLNILKNDPNVETVGTGTHAIPFNYNFIGHILRSVNENGDSIMLNFNCRAYDGNALKALRVTGTRGETPEQLASYLDNGQAIISDFDKYSEPDEGLPMPEEFRGKEAEAYGKLWQMATTGVDYLRRTDYEPNSRSVVLMLPLGPQDFPGEVIIRIKHGCDRSFKEAVSNMNLRVGNVYISDIQSVTDIRRNIQLPDKIGILKQISIITFVLALIFLGFLGTYWFRIQERVSEIAIRKVAGATPSAILRRLYAEGFILMGTAIAIALSLSYIIQEKELLMQLTSFVFPDKASRYGMAATAVVMAMMVLAGIYFPARKAMKIKPAVALKDQ